MPSPTVPSDNLTSSPLATPCTPNQHRRGSFSSGTVKAPLFVRSSSSEELVAARNNLGMRINFKYLPGKGSPPHIPLPVPFVNPLNYSPKNKPRSLFRDALPLHFTPNRKAPSFHPMYRLSIFALVLFLISYVAALTLARSRLHPLFDSISRFNFKSSSPHLIPRTFEPRCDDEPIYLVRTRDFDAPSPVVHTPPQDQMTLLPPPSTPEQGLALDLQTKQRMDKERETITLVLVEESNYAGYQYHNGPALPTPQPEVVSGESTPTFVDQSGSWRGQVSSQERGVFGRRRPNFFVDQSDGTPVLKASRWGWWRSKASMLESLQAKNAAVATMGSQRTEPVLGSSFVDMQVDMVEAAPVRKDLRRIIRLTAGK